MKTQLIIVLMSSLNFFKCDTQKLKRSDNILDLISGAGYVGEAHKVVTEDGYLLKVHRVLANPAETRTLRKPAFLMHGILATGWHYFRNFVSSYGIKCGFFLFCPSSSRQLRTS